MNIEDWELYRRIEMYQIEEEIDIEIEKEIISAIYQKYAFPKPSLTLLQIGMISLIIIIIMCLYPYIAINYPTQLLALIESPYLKPIVLGGFPGLYGLYARKKSQNQHEHVKKKILI